MTGISHKLAQRYLRAAADGLIRDNQRVILDAHLRECDSCRAEADELNALEARLQKNFQARWDASDGPSRNVMTTIQSRSRRIIMTNRINTGLKTLAGIAALLVLIVFLNSAFKQLQENSQQGTIVPGSTSSIPYPITSTQSSSEELSTPDEFSMTVQEAEALAGFDVLEPSHLPEGYVLQDALYNSQAKLVELRYISSPTTQDSGGSGLIIVNQKWGIFDLGPALHPYETPVSIGDVEGIFIRGAYISDATDGRAYKWDALGDVYSLSWQKDKMAYTISFLGGETIPPISLAELVAIAESMKSVPTAQQIPPIGTDQSNGEWIAFIGGRTIPDNVYPTALTMTQDIYITHPNGTGLINITNNKDYIGDIYENLQWSPDGKNLVFLRIQNDKYDFIRTNPDSSGYSTIAKPITDPEHYGYSWSPNSTQIAFADSSNGNYDIYTVYADGRNDPQLTQLTNDPGQDIGFVWSPDGNQIAYQRLDGDKLSLYIMNADGSNQREVAKGSGNVNLRWSQDGMSIYASTRTENDWLDCETCVHKAGIYRIYLNVVQAHQIYYEQDASKVDGWYLYDTPQDTLYFMRIHHSAFLNFQGIWSYVDGNSVREIGEMDPHQTCKTTTGNSLGEHISPNERFSIISDFCAGGFDLYLADREAATPEKQLTHLLRLPLSTWGQGGDGAYLPIHWSPDGRWVIYEDDGSAYLLNVETVMQNPAAEPSILIQPKYYTNPSGTYPSPENISVLDFAWQPRP